MNYLIRTRFSAYCVGSMTLQSSHECHLVDRPSMVTWRAVEAGIVELVKTPPKLDRRHRKMGTLGWRTLGMADLNRCIVLLATVCRLRLSALVNQARTAGRTSNLDKTGMLTRTCRWASIVLAFKLQRWSSLRMLYPLTSLSTSQECGLAAKIRARASDIGSHSLFERHELQYILQM